MGSPNHDFHIDGSAVIAAIKRVIVLAAAMTMFAFAAPAVAMAPQRTVTYFEQATASDTTSFYQTGSSPAPLTQESTFTPLFANSGHVFVSWNTEANGSGSVYLDGADFSFASDLTLYAQWSQMATNYTVTFFENSTPNDPAIQYMTGNSTAQLTSFSVLTPSFKNSGQIFNGWNTSPSGAGIAYSDGSVYTFTSDLSLYAQWQLAAVVTTSFNSNGGSGLAPPITVSAGNSTILPLSSGISFPGHNFIGWNTASDGSGTEYIGGSTYVFSGNQVLYAQWALDVYSVTFSPGSGSVSPALFNFSFGNPSILLPSPVNATATFVGWFTAPTGGTLVGLAGASYLPTASVTLYAQWSLVVNDTLTFDANGGSGSVAPMTGLTGSTVVLPGQAGLLFAGFVLSHWNSSVNGKGTSYNVGQTMTLSGSSTLYAQWSGHAPLTLFGAVGTFAKNRSALSNVLKNQVKRLAAVIKSKKYHSVTLYGYTASTGLATYNMSLSRARAATVATYLRTQLRVIKFSGVSIKSAGEGSVAGSRSAAYSRVEVFVI